MFCTVYLKPDQAIIEDEEPDEPPAKKRNVFDDEAETCLVIMIVMIGSFQVCLLQSFPHHMTRISCQN